MRQRKGKGHRPVGRARTPAAPERPRLSLRRKLIYSVLTVVLILGCLEGLSRAVVELAPSARWTYSRNLTATLGFPEWNAVFVPDEHLFWRIKGGLKQHQVSGRIANSPRLSFTVSTDADGFRRLPVVKAPKHHVVFLGDSCTFGLGVDDGQTFPAVIQARLERVQCVNLGIPGHTAYQGRVLLDRFDFDPVPDAAVITFGRNDDLVWDHLSDIDHAQLISKQRSGWAVRSRFLGLLRQVLPQGAGAGTARSGARRPRLSDREFSEQIGYMIRWCRARQVEPILVIWPDRRQLRLGSVHPKQMVLSRIAEAQGVRLVNLIPWFQQHIRDQKLYVDAVHVSPAGARVVADAILPVLESVLDRPDEHLPGG